jgi:ketosteroid isomerase-like protein
LACEAAAVSQMRYRGVVHATGRRFDIQAVWVCDIQDGKVVRMQEYLDTLAFKEAYAAPS